LRCQLVLATLACVFNNTHIKERSEDEMSTTQTKLPAGTWNLDPVHSAVGFEVDYLAGTFRGEFRDVQVELDTADSGARIQGSAEVASVDVKDENLAAHLQSPDFFDAERNPELTFDSTEVARDGQSLAVRGELTLKGITRPVELTGTIGEPLTDAFGRPRTGVRLSTTIDRTAFGIDWNMPLPSGEPALGTDVTLDAELYFVEEA
jgi:polyisoprenoid-binding protein YceI